MSEMRSFCLWERRRCNFTIDIAKDASDLKAEIEPLQRGEAREESKLVNKTCGAHNGNDSLECQGLRKVKEGTLKPTVTMLETERRKKIGPERSEMRC